MSIRPMGLSPSSAAGAWTQGNTRFMPKNLNTMVLFGDSISALCIAVNGVYTYYSSRGYWTWANVLGLNHRLSVTNFAGVSGNTTTQMLARIQTDVIAYAPGWCLVEGGTNDVASSATAATIQANLTAIYDALDQAGIRVVATTIPPRASLTAAQFAVQQAVNVWLRTLARSRKNFVLVDWTSRLIDPSLTAVGAYLSTLTSDGVHPNTAGAARMGKAVVDVLAPLLPSVDHIDAAGGDLTNLLLNPLMAQTNGTVSAPVTGQAAGLWQLTRTGSAGLTAVGSLVARTDQVAGQWQQLQVTATSGDTARIIQEVTSGKYAAGDRVYLSAEVQVDSDFVPTGGGGVCRLLLLSSNSGFSAVGGCYDWYLDSNDTFPTENRPTNTMWLRTPVLTIPATAAHLFGIFEWCGLGTVRMGRTELRKV